VTRCQFNSVVSKIIALLILLLLALPFSAYAANSEVPAALKQFSALLMHQADGTAIKLKPAECTNLNGSGSPAFQSCFVNEASGCFYVQTQAENINPSIFAFAADLKPHCSAAAISKAETAFLEVFLSCGDSDPKVQAIANFLANPLDLSSDTAYDEYSDYVAEHDAYPGYQLKDACPAMTGVNIHDMIDGFPHRGIALYDLSISSGSHPVKPKAN
jgi:hypothetical protein